MTDVSDPKAVREAIKAEKSKEQIAKDGLLTMMSSLQGRAWLHSLLMKCDCFRNCFNSDALLMAHRTGEVNIGLQVIAEMHEASPDLYLQMMKENQK